MIESVRSTHLPLPLLLSESDIRRNSTRIIFYKRLPTDSTDSGKVQNSVRFSKQILLCRGYKNKTRKGAGAMATVTQHLHRLVQAFVRSQGLIFIFWVRIFRYWTLKWVIIFANWNFTQTLLAINFTNHNPYTVPWLQPRVKDVLSQKHAFSFRDEKQILMF